MITFWRIRRVLSTAGAASLLWALLARYPQHPILSALLLLCWLDCAYTISRCLPRRRYRSRTRRW
jgi:hypothetical protein